MWKRTMISTLSKPDTKSSGFSIVEQKIIKVLLYYNNWYKSFDTDFFYILQSKEIQQIQIGWIPLLAQR